MTGARRKVVSTVTAFKGSYNLDRMDDAQLERYSRHILLPQIDIAGQQRLLESRVLIIGAGGLGSPVALYLAASGIGQIAISDYDQVELSNLQRQIIHKTNDIGRNKVDVAREAMRSLNPDINIDTFALCLEGSALKEQVCHADVVIDASDNFDTRFTLNDVCVDEMTPLVSGAVIRMEGQATVFRNELQSSPCYRCLYSNADSALPEESCSDSGILAPVAGVIGAVMATEALKLLLGLGETLCGRLLLFDASCMEWRNLRLPKDPQCPVCSSRN